MTRSIRLIVAVSPEGAIGLDGRIPWHHSGDLQRFKALTTGHTILMGRKTWDSLPKRPLPNRKNVVVSRSARDGELRDGATWFSSPSAALAALDGQVWCIGGAELYRETLPLADLIDVTYVPDRVDDARAVKLPAIDPARFIAGPLVPHEYEPGLTRREFRRVGA